MAGTPRTPAQKRALRRRCIAVSVLGLTVTAIVMYLLGVGWVVRSLDAFWQLVDISIERLRIVAALLPLAVAYVAYRVYRTDRWWKRAEWGLNASLETGNDDKRSKGDLFMTLLAESGMAPKDDLRIWNRLKANERSDILNEIVARVEEEEEGQGGALPPPADSPLCESAVPAPTEPIGSADLVDLLSEFLVWQRAKGIAELTTGQATQLIMDAGHWTGECAVEPEPRSRLPWDNT